MIVFHAPTGSRRGATLCAVADGVVHGRDLAHPVEKLSRHEVVVMIRELHVESAIHSGQETANRSRRGLRNLDRSIDAERSATFHLKLAALWRIAEKKGISEEEVFGP